MTIPAKTDKIIKRLRNRIGEMGAMDIPVVWQELMILLEACDQRRAALSVYEHSGDEPRFDIPAVALEALTNVAVERGAMLEEIAQLKRDLAHAEKQIDWDRAPSHMSHVLI